MAIAFDNTSGQVIASSTSYVVTKPAHVHDGDLILVVFGQDGVGTASTGVPSGFTQIGAGQAAAIDSTLWVFWKIAASEPSSWTWTWDVARPGSAEVTTYTGHHASLPVGATVNVDYKHGQVNGTAVAAGPITPPVNDCMIVATIGADPAGALTLTAGSPATERVDRVNGTISYVGLIEWQQSTAASVTLNATMSATDDYTWNVFAIRPVAVAASTFVPQIMIVS